MKTKRNLTLAVLGMLAVANGGCMDAPVQECHTGRALLKMIDTYELVLLSALVGNAKPGSSQQDPDKDWNYHTLIEGKYDKIVPLLSDEDRAETIRKFCSQVVDTDKTREEILRECTPLAEDANTPFGRTYRIVLPKFLRDRSIVVLNQAVDKYLPHVNDEGRVEAMALEADLRHLFKGSYEERFNRIDRIRRNSALALGEGYCRNVFLLRDQYSERTNASAGTTDSDANPIEERLALGPKPERKSAAGPAL